ncbi:MAG TPA: hypothetical protein P5523_03700 [Bacteroidales bacterium]|nr:hypothetical protein [Nitrosomonas sp.]HRT83721.1 hypothetical protein [Bacteroidales bacterium]
MGGEAPLRGNAYKPPPPPTPTDPAVAKAQADAAEAERKIKGRASTIIGGTAGGSLTSTPATTAKRTLSA